VIHEVRIRRCAITAAVVALVGCSAPPPAPTASPAGDSIFSAEEAASLITREFLAGHIRTLSGDDYEGRGTATAADQKTRRYLIDQLKDLGFEPGAAGGGWEQPVDVVGISAVVPEQWTFRVGERSITMRRHEDFVAVSGVQSASAAMTDAEVVFAGFGIEAPEQGWDDFKDVDLRGKVLLMLNNDPDWDPALFAGETRLYYGRWMYKYESAARQGAVGAIIIHTAASAGYPWSVVQSSWAGEQFELPAGEEPRLQVSTWMTEAAARRLVNLAGRSLDELVASARRSDFRPVPLGLTTSLQLTNTIRLTQTANVLGVLRGRDPGLADEALILSAHFDHLGVGEPDQTGDRIYNGAADNASGMAVVLGIARAITALPEPPRRSVLILFPAAEEQGLLGSAAYAAAPTVPAGRLAANLNFDIANFFGRTRDITLVGLGKSSLDEQARLVAQHQGRVVMPDQYPDRGYYYRSDHYNLAKIGVPGLSMKAGTEVIGRPAGWGREQHDAYDAIRYHQRSDEFDESWNFEGMIEDARFGFMMALAIANDDRLPSWTPGDEFEAARKRALAEIAD
jgi:Zn-dependent M28 family amino/carboxypeptidase